MTAARIYQLLKNGYHFLQAHLWRIVYGRPDRSLRLYGVTGTNGKTTTAFVLDSILRQARGGDHVGMLSTERFHVGEAIEPNETHMTSIDSRKLYFYLKRMRDRGVTDVVLEMTSHALDQHRAAGIQLEGGIVLNITHEHLDYHKTMEEYMRAKGKIASYIKGGGVLVLNISDEWTKRLRKTINDTRVTVIPFTSEEARQVTTPLPGEFNKENVLAAMKLAGAVGVSDEDIRAGVQAVDHVPGRVEWIEAPGGFRVVIDFALTPDAMERLYIYLKEETQGRLVTVFGAAGRRDRAKRPIITKIASSYADEIILTQDEPYDDPEEEIYAELEAGLADTDVTWRRIEDRREAFEYALAHAKAGDVIAITGMGNYNTRGVGSQQIPWNDRQVVEEILED